MKQFSGWQIGVLALLFLCVCCVFAGASMAALVVLWDTSPVARAQASLTPTLTRGAITNTGASAPLATRTPTRLRNPYTVVIPTPGAPTTQYPTEFSSQFTVVTYNVTGRTISEISKSLEANPISDPSEPGSRYYALTRWQLAGDWSVRPTLRGCEVTSGQVKVTITMTLPLLTSTNTAADALNRFNTFLEKTVLHESGHVEITLQGAREYERALGNHPLAPSCDALKTQLNDLFRRNFDTIQRANRDYDVKTQHGRTQGAVFP